MRDSGTVGGNIANGSPIGDLAPALIALGGGSCLRKGARARGLPLEDFFIAYGKQDRAPRRVRGARSRRRPSAANQRYRAFKVSKRFDEDISAVMLGAFALDLDGRRDRRRADRLRRHGGDAEAGGERRSARCSAPVSTTRRELAARRWPRSPPTFTPLTDMRATAAYRMTVAAQSCCARR